jgi:hypothetical protein
LGFTDFAVKRLTRRQRCAKHHGTGDVKAGRLRVVDEQTTAGNMTDLPQRGARHPKGQSSNGWQLEPSIGADAAPCDPRAYEYLFGASTNYPI